MADYGCMAIDIPDECNGLVMMQRGVVGRDQAIEAGLSGASITTLLRTNRWQRLHCGVYAAFTGVPRHEALLWAALIRAGPDSMLSYMTAASLFGFADTPRGRESPIHVTVPWNKHLGQIRGVVVHRSRHAHDGRHPYLLPPQTRPRRPFLIWLRKRKRLRTPLPGYAERSARG